MDIPSNPAKIPWPTDKAGVTSRLKREGCRAIGRIAGDDNNYELVMQVLRILGQHAKDKLVEQQDVHKGNLVRLANQRARAEDANDRRSSAMETSLINQAETLKNRLIALQKRKQTAIERVAKADEYKKTLAAKAALIVEQDRDALGLGTAKS